MEQNAAPPPLTTTTPAGISTTTTTTHPTSVDSSPRSRTIDSWVEDTSPYPNPNNTTSTAAPATKLRLMCSSGGHIVPRPHDKSLCYVGGDTRIVVVDRHTTLSDLTNRLTKSVLRSTATTSFTIKYQLPNEDLDSLISVTTDEDLENMIDEYDRLNNLNMTSSSRIRLFLFPVKPESVSSIGSVLESATKSEDWFLNMLNGNCNDNGNGNGNGMSSAFSDTTSVNGLLGLEDDVPVAEKKDVSGKGVAGRGLRGNNSVQDVQSVPDSPMLETTSSFGSASSTPSMVNVPPVTANVDDQVNVKCHEDVNFVAEPVPVVVIDDLNPKPKPSMDSVSSDGRPPVIFQDPAAHAQVATNNVIDQNTRIQIQQVKDSSYLLSTPAAQPARVDTQNHQMHHQPQFIHTAVPPPQYLQHHPSGMVPMASYYQIYPSQTQYHAPHQALDQHNLVYYMPARQPPQGYNLPLQADASPAVSAPPNNQVPPPSGLITAPRVAQPVPKTEAPAGMYRTTASPGAAAPQLVQVPSSHQQMQPQFVGYSHAPQPSQLVASGGSGGNYVYEFADPSQQGQRMYYAAQPLPPQSATQYQNIASTLPVEAQGGSHMNQQVRTSQP
ncbi:putative PB1 domain-containing protein [Helianthus annuus]|nr:putative PB1 domain-containing protein [Helianthus annuus]